MSEPEHSAIHLTLDVFSGQSVLTLSLLALQSILGLGNAGKDAAGMYAVPNHMVEPYSREMQSGDPVEHQFSL